jgi:hypothetical protein
MILELIGGQLAPRCNMFYDGPIVPRLFLITENHVHYGFQTPGPELFPKRFMRD